MSIENKITIDTVYPPGKMSQIELERYISVLLGKKVDSSYALTEEDLDLIEKDTLEKNNILLKFMSYYGSSFDTCFNTYWLGKQVVKSPLDLWVYQEIITATKPTLIIECGTNGSGSAFFFLTLLKLLDLKDTKIITIDTIRTKHLEIVDPQIEYIYGDSVDPAIVKYVQQRAQGQKTMISLDSLHTYDHVIQELEAYGDLTSPGCYCVIEDTGFNILGGSSKNGAGGAAGEFLEKRKGIFERDFFAERHMYTSNYGGWLKRLI